MSFTVADFEGKRPVLLLWTSPMKKLFIYLWSSWHVPCCLFTAESLPGQVVRTVCTVSIQWFTKAFAIQHGQPSRSRATCCWLTVDPALIRRRCMYTPRISPIDQIISATFEKQTVNTDWKNAIVFFFHFANVVCKISLSLFLLGFFLFPAA